MANSDVKIKVKIECPQCKEEWPLELEYITTVTRTVPRITDSSWRCKTKCNCGVLLSVEAKAEKEVDSD